jgi:hydroxymethylpyrimidine pyrophosphatase-like HAD family hydrolase
MHDVYGGTMNQPNPSTKLALLLEITKKKLKTLEEILNITENQNTIARQDLVDHDLFSQLHEEKQLRIDKLTELDNYFQSVYTEIKPELDSHPELFRQSIKVIKQLIKDITELEMQIQLAEEKNRQLLYLKSMQQMMPLKPITVSKSTAAKRYHDQKKLHKDLGFMEKK